MPSSRGASWHGDRIRVSWTASRFFPSEPPGKSNSFLILPLKIRFWTKTFWWSFLNAVASNRTQQQPTAFWMCFWSMPSHTCHGLWDNNNYYVFKWWCLNRFNCKRVLQLVLLVSVHKVIIIAIEQNSYLSLAVASEYLLNHVSTDQVVLDLSTFTGLKVDSDLSVDSDFPSWCYKRH